MVQDGGRVITTAIVETVHPKIDKWKMYDLLEYKVHHKEVKRFHNSEARIKVACGPRRSTKSYAAAHDVLDKCLWPNSRIWIVGPSYGLAEKEFRYIHEKLVLNRDKLGLPPPRVCKTNPASGSLYIEWPWGAIVEGKSADRPDGLLGEAVDAIIYSEAAQLKRKIRERYTQPTTVTKKGIEIIPTTPDQGGEWVLELYEKGQDAFYDDIEAFHWDLRANPLYDIEEFERAKKLYGEDSPVFREQFLGEWVFYGGRVYNNFDPNMHVIEPFEIPEHWPVVRGIDFGHRDPFVCLLCAVGPSGELYFFREYYERAGKPTRENAKAIKRMSEGCNVTITVADPSGAQTIEDLGMEGVPCTEADNGISAGRLRVLEYLAPSEDGPIPFNLRNLPVGLSRSTRPRMYFFSTMKETLREMRYFRWKEGRSIEGEKERTEGEDHAMDTMRYICMTRPSPMKMRYRAAPNSFQWHMNQVQTQKAQNSFIGRS